MNSTSFVTLIIIISLIYEHNKKNGTGRKKKQNPRQKAFETLLFFIQFDGKFFVFGSCENLSSFADQERNQKFGHQLQ